MITERTDQIIEVQDDGSLVIRDWRILEENGAELTRFVHRRGLEPARTVPGTETARIQAVAGVVWTKEVVDAYEEKRAKPPAMPGSGTIGAGNGPIR